MLLTSTMSVKAMDYMIEPPYLGAWDTFKIGWSVNTKAFDETSLKVKGYMGLR